MNTILSTLRRFRFAVFAFALLCGPAALQALAEGQGHGSEGEGSGIPELPNVIEILHKYFRGKPQGAFFDKLFEFQNVVFYFIIAFLLIFLSWLGTRRLKKIPTGFQAFLEFVVTTLDNFVCSIIGPKGHAYVPLCGTIFLFILLMNLSGFIPLAKSPIALNINVPATLAICVFIFVQYHGIRQNGFVGYLKHFADGPVFMLWLLVPLHIIGELAKPLTLTLRLFGNITGEDIVIAVLVILGVGLFFPLQILFFPLALLFSFIQALVFTILSSVYILLLMHHEDLEGSH